MNWSSLIVFFALGLLGLWVAYSFLNKKGLYLFSFISVVCCNIIYPASVFSQQIDISIVLMPLVFLALLTCYNKFGKQESVKLFVLTLTTQIVLFVVNFLQSAYLDVSYQTQMFLTWEALGSGICYILGYAVASIIGLVFIEKIRLNSTNYKWVKSSIYVFVASTINMLVFEIISNIGLISFGSILLILLISIVITFVLSVFLGFFEKYLNRQLAVRTVEKTTKEEDNKNIEENSDKQNLEEISNKEKKKNSNSDDDENINYENSAF